MEARKPRHIRIVHTNVLKSPVRTSRPPNNFYRGVVRNKHAQVFVIALFGTGRVLVNGIYVDELQDECHIRYMNLFDQESMKKYDWKIRSYARNPIAEICALRQAIGRCLLSMVPQTPPKSPRWGGKRTSPVKRRFPSLRYTPRPRDSASIKDRRDVDFQLRFDDSCVDAENSSDVNEISDRMNAIHLWYKTQLLQEQLQNGTKRCSRNMVNINGRRMDQNGNLL